MLLVPHGVVPLRALVGTTSTVAVSIRAEMSEPLIREIVRKKIMYTRHRVANDLQSCLLFLATVYRMVPAQHSCTLAGSLALWLYEVGVLGRVMQSWIPGDADFFVTSVEAYNAIKEGLSAKYSAEVNSDIVFNYDHPGISQADRQQYGFTVCANRPLPAAVCSDSRCFPCPIQQRPVGVRCLLDMLRQMIREPTPQQSRYFEKYHIPSDLIKTVLVQLKAFDAAAHTMNADPLSGYRSYNIHRTCEMFIEPNGGFFKMPIFHKDKVDSYTMNRVNIILISRDIAVELAAWEASPDKPAEELTSMDIIKSFDLNVCQVAVELKPDFRSIHPVYRPPTSFRDIRFVMPPEVRTALQAQKPLLKLTRSSFAALRSTSHYITRITGAINRQLRRFAKYQRRFPEPDLSASESMVVD
jgi:hypothetical protein